MIKEKIGLQLWTLHEKLNNPSEISATFANIRGLGFEFIELACLEKYDYKEVKQWLNNADLKTPSAGITLDDLLEKKYF